MMEIAIFNPLYDSIIKLAQKYPKEKKLIKEIQEIVNEIEEKWPKRSREVNFDFSRFPLDSEMVPGYTENSEKYNDIDFDFVKTLCNTEGVKKNAIAHELGIGRTTLWRRLKDSK